MMMPTAALFGLICRRFRIRFPAGFAASAASRRTEGRRHYTASPPNPASPAAHHTDLPQPDAYFIY